MATSCHTLMIMHARMKMFGFRHAYFNPWNRYDFLMLSLFLACFMCWIWSYVDVLRHDRKWRYQAKRAERRRDSKSVKFGIDPN
jgi:hypothetical protein